MLPRNTTARLFTTLADTDLYPPLEPFFLGVNETIYRFWINQYDKVLKNLTISLRAGKLWPVNDNLSLVPTQYDTIGVWRNPYNNYDEEVIFSRASHQPENPYFERFIFNLFDNFTREFSGELNPHIKGVGLGVFFTIIIFTFLMLLVSRYLSSRERARELANRLDNGDVLPVLPKPGCYETICGGRNLFDRIVRAEMSQQTSPIVEEEIIVIRP